MNLKYVIYREDKYCVAQCLNVDVSTFGESIQEAQQNLREAVELYFEGEGKKADYIEIEEVLLGETVFSETRLCSIRPKREPSEIQQREPYGHRS